MRRRRVLGAASAALAWRAPVALAWAANPPRIGWMWSGRSTYDPNEVKGFRQGLRDLGYVEGQNIVVEYRFGEGSDDRMHDLAADLVRLPVEVVVVIGPAALLALRRTGTTIPIVAVTDLVDQHLVESVAHPGGTITGIDFFGANLTAKRLQLLKEAIPTLSRVGLLFNPKVRPKALVEAEGAAPTLDLVLRVYPVKMIEELKPAIARLKADTVEAIVVDSVPPLIVYQRETVELALTAQIPAASEQPEFAQYGGLLSYGPSIFSIAQRQAYYVDRILKGTKAADLPVEFPTSFDLVINLKTAKALGLTISPSLLAQADAVLE